MPQGESNSPEDVKRLGGPTGWKILWEALMRGCDIDKPRNLAKSVTVE